MEIEEVLLALQSGSKGLSREEAEQRLRKFGYNELEEREKASALRIFLAQFKNVFVIVLLAAIAISVILGWLEAQASAEPKKAMETYVDAITIGIIVFLNAIVGFIQEYRSEKAVEAMRKLAAPNARVLRGGRRLLFLRVKSYLAISFSSRVVTA